MIERIISRLEQLENKENPTIKDLKEIEKLKRQIDSWKGKKRKK